MKTFTIQVLNNAAAKRPPGYIDDVLSHGTIAGDRVTLSEEAYAMLVAKYRIPNALVPKTTEDRQPRPKGGPGTELKKLLRALGIVAKPNCSCNRRAMMMDERGVEWCEANIEEIVGWLREEATKRKLPFVDLAGRMLIRRAIANARRAAS